MSMVMLLKLVILVPMMINADDRWKAGGRGGPSRPLRLPARIHLPPQHCHSDRRRQKKLKKREKKSLNS